TPDKIIDPGAGSPNLLLYSEIHVLKFPQDTFMAVPGDYPVWLETGVTVGPGNWMVINGSGQINSGQWFSGPNGPQGWNAIADNSFPLPGTRPYSLIGWIYRPTLIWDHFYIGQSFATPINRDVVNETS